MGVSVAFSCRSSCSKHEKLQFVFLGILFFVLHFVKFVVSKKLDRKF